MHFVKAFKDWEPGHIEQSVDQESQSDGTVLGCSTGHPSEVILILIQEISQITSSITESKWRCWTNNSSYFYISYIIISSITFEVWHLTLQLYLYKLPFMSVIISLHIVLIEWFEITTVLWKEHNIFPNFRYHWLNQQFYPVTASVLYRIEYSYN